MARGRWPLYGAAFAVTWMVGQSWPTALPGAPDGSGDDFERFYAGNEAVHLLAAVLTAIAALALVMFTRGLAHALAEVGYNRRLVPAAGLGASALFLISSVFPMIAVVVNGDRGEMWWQLSNLVSTLGFIVAAGLAWAIGALTPTRRVPRVLARVVALFLLVPLMWWLTAKIFLLWLLVMSIWLALARRPQAVDSPSTSPRAP